MTKRLETVATMACMKTLLMIFNCVFWVFGILILYIGIWMRIHLRDLSAEGSKAILLGVASLGAILTLSTMLACCCTTRGHPALLYLYGAFLAVIAIMELGAGASIYACLSNLNETFDQNMNETMSLYGENKKKTDDINIIQSTLACCGNRGYTDWLKMYPPREIPQSCCKVTAESCDVTNTNDIYTQGCYTRVLDFINNNFSMIAGLGVGVASFPFIGVLLACCLASNINKANYEQVA
ncbi:tetraspanin-7 [Xylocopa sonorina]|uniref:tetraspanin-7 n=1 Tax=Xylocopa sonorina TaxID=1818115 RepID=UPI00403AF6A1